MSMRIAWVHNYDPRGPGNGMFMWQLYDEFERQGVQIRDVRVSNLRTIAGARDAVRRIREETADCDIVHTQYGSLVGWLGSRTRARSVVTLRGSDWHIVPAAVSIGQHLHGLAAHHLTCRAIPRYDAVITCSQPSAPATCTPSPTASISTASAPTTACRPAPPSGPPATPGPGCCSRAT